MLATVGSLVTVGKHGLEELAQRESPEWKGYLKQRMEGGPEGGDGTGGKAAHLSPQLRPRLKVGHQPGQRQEEKLGGEALRPRVSLL